MGTPYTECYDAFLSHVDDVELLYPYNEETDEEHSKRLDNTLNMLFKNSVVKFRFAKTKLSRNDMLEEFLYELRPLEVEIIGLLMLKEYYRKKLNFLVQVKHSLSDKDWKMHDKSSQMSQYRQLVTDIDNEIRQLIVDNSYSTSDGALDLWSNE